jgi:hypothetical protein
MLLFQALQLPVALKHLRVRLVLVVLRTGEALLGDE